MIAIIFGVFSTGLRPATAGPAYPKSPKVIGKVQTDEEKAHIFRIASSKPSWLTVFCAGVIAVSTSCRSVELKNLRWRDVDVFTQILMVRRSKTEAGLRTIPLNRDAILDFAKLKERAEAIGSMEPTHFVFAACEKHQFDPTKPQKGWRSSWRILTKAACPELGRTLTDCHDSICRTRLLKLHIVNG